MRSAGLPGYVRLWRDSVAKVFVLFGVGPGIADQAFANAYIDPTSSIPGVASASDQLVTFVQQYVSDQQTRLGQTGQITTLSPSQAWAEFQQLPAYLQQAFIDRVFFQILNQTGLDYNQQSSPYYHQYARGYQAINTLFPASYGYTANSLAGGGNGANSLVATGNLDIRGSTIQTRQGGNITIMGPGGKALIGSSSAPPD